jgi:hypothetical protein
MWGVQYSQQALGAGARWLPTDSDAHLHLPPALGPRALHGTCTSRKCAAVRTQHAAAAGPLTRPHRRRPAACSSASCQGATTAAWPSPPLTLAFVPDLVHRDEYHA